MRSTTGGQHTFAEIPNTNIQRSSLNRSCGLKTTFDAGWITPIFLDEALPGDTMNLRMTSFGRLATPQHPFFDNIFLDYHFFAIPHRLIWDNWEKFCGAQENPGDSTTYNIPQIDAPATTGWLENSLEDYFGLPIGVPDLKHSALFHRAYNLVFNEWYRDQNLIDSLPVPTGDGPDIHQTYSLQRRGKRHDYFTSALPWPQKGPSVSIGFGDTAPVLLDSGQTPDAIGKNNAPTFNPDTYSNANTLQVMGTSNSGPQYFSGEIAYSGTVEKSSDHALWWDDPALETSMDGITGVADLASATATTINAIREAFQVQRLYERDARGGTRYVEMLRVHFGITNHPDARLQRPEYLGGGRSMVNVNPIAQTSATDPAVSPQANLAGVGTTVGSAGFTKSFVEHCIIMGFVSARADLNYQQGLDRMFSRVTRFDYYWPALAHLGEQELYQKEIFADGTVNDNIVFGYQERFAEYRYKPSKITGQFRSQATTPLDTWHLAQDFDTAPTLSQAFIEENPPIDRVIAVQTEPHFMLDCYFQYRCARPMPVYSVPGLIDHF